MKFEGKKIRVGGVLSFAASQMLQLGSFANKTVIARARAGIGSDDVPFPPLKSGGYAVYGKKGTFVRKGWDYPARKVAHGLSSERDLWGFGRGGHMLDNSTVRYADSSTVKIAFTSRMGRIKALSNEKRTPFYSFSDADTQKIMAYAEMLWHSNIAQILPKFKKAA